MTRGKPVWSDRAVEVRQSRVSLSVFDLFKIGIGSSSSHTVGPMETALRLTQLLQKQGVLTQVQPGTTG